MGFKWSLYLLTVKVKLLSRVQLFVTPWTVAYQAPLSIGIFQARVLEWVATSFSGGSSQPRDWTQVSHIAGRHFTIWATWGTLGVTGKSGLTEWGRAKANRVLPRECAGHSKHPLPTTQEKTLHVDITEGQYQKQTDYIICSKRWRSSTQSAKTRLGAAAAQIMNSLLQNST